MNTLIVSEIFTSIQGESHWAGYPCTFVRLTGCNLDCIYCDTGYAREGGQEMTVESIVEKVREHSAPLVEVTGGEPLCQEGAPKLLAALSELDARVLLETNGSLPMDDVPPGVVIIMDLKAPSSGMADHNRWENLARLGEEDEIKVVIGGREDFDWAVGELRERKIFGRVKVSFSPVAGAVEPVVLAGWMVDESIDARFQLQLHRVLWPDTDRGV